MDSWQYRPALDRELAPMARWRSLHREAGLVGRFSQLAWRVLVRVYLRIYHRLKVEGLEHVPLRPPFILVGNHASHLDALVLGAALPWPLRRAVFPIAAGDVFFETPVASWFSAMMLNALPMWRKRCGSHAMQELRERLVAEPAIYLLFPEGTRSRDGNMGKFRSGIGMMIAGAPVPVIPCYLTGAYAACPPDARLPRPRPLHLQIGPGHDFSATPNTREGWEKIAADLESAVCALREAKVRTS